LTALFLPGLYHLAPEVLNALKIVKPETVIRWHRAASGLIGAGDRGRARASRKRRSSYAGSFAMSVWPTRSAHGSMVNSFGHSMT
jgi:hypothetical protein